MRMNTLRTLFIRLSGVAIAAALWAVPGAARAQAIYVGTANGFSSTTAGSVSQFDLNGNSVTPNLITGIGGPFGLAATSTDVYYTDNDNGLVGDYNIGTATLNPSLISVGGPTGILVSGSMLYVSAQYDGTVKQYSTGGTL